MAYKDRDLQRDFADSASGTQKAQSLGELAESEMRLKHIAAGNLNAIKRDIQKGLSEEQLNDGLREALLRGQEEAARLYMKGGANAAAVLREMEYYLNPKGLDEFSRMDPRDYGRAVRIVSKIRPEIEAERLARIERRIQNGMSEEELNDGLKEALLGRQKEAARLYMKGGANADTVLREMEYYLSPKGLDAFNRIEPHEYERAVDIVSEIERDESSKTMIYRNGAPKPPGMGM